MYGLVLGRIRKSIEIDLYVTTTPRYRSLRLSLWPPLCRSHVPLSFPLRQANYVCTLNRETFYILHTIHFHEFVGLHNF